ncbi:hypothetical protein NQ317_005490 [Molorchus minor]|uniref:Uncharacterized protein n=1 Tax=Molorchus minor TaxID=1323400 RepID=A0ABQ9JS39_9CUCU|nr:hypothetical protein NQ317_005490 [Molorchus minor]
MDRSSSNQGTAGAGQVGPRWALFYLPLPSIYLFTLPTVSLSLPDLLIKVRISLQPKTANLSLLNAWHCPTFHRLLRILGKLGPPLYLTIIGVVSVCSDLSGCRLIDSGFPDSGPVSNRTEPGGYRNISNVLTITTGIDRKSDGLEDYAKSKGLWDGQVSVMSTSKPNIHWFTATPDPSMSVFKPFIFTKNVTISKHTKCPNAEPQCVQISILGVSKHADQ